MKPVLKILEREAILRLRQAAFDLLEQVGVRFDSSEAERVFLEAGQKLDVATRTVRLAPELVERCLAQLPRNVLLAARDPERDVILGSGGVHTCLDGQGTFTLDSETGQRRPSTLDDLVRATRVSDALESIDYYWVPVVPGDVPDSVRTLVEVATGFIHTSRHIQHEIKHPHQAPQLLEMLDALIGDRRRHRERPVFSIVCCPVSPLRHEPDMTAASMELARHFVPICLMPMPLSGATGPVTLAGNVVLTLAEFLSGVALFQLVQPGCPMILGIGSSILDMRTGLYSAGAPELSLLNIALTEMGHHLGVPVMAQGVVSDAKVPGVQAAYEKAMNGLTAVLAGSDALNGVGLLDAHQLLSFEQMVIDDEIVRQARRIGGGFAIDDERLMLALIGEVGIGGHFLGKRATLEYLRKGEHFQPRFSYRGSFESWHERGFDELALARGQVQRILEEHPVMPLAPEVEEALNQIVLRADESAQVARLTSRDMP
ncbi:MAG: trimethylamine methyltransferase family protein [Acidobacteriota bacterium]